MTGPGPSAAGPREKATLSRDLADFLIEFSISLHKHAMYPGGHPSLLPAAEGVVNRLEVALLDRASLSLGVARSQLVIEGVATDPRNPVLKDLASRLHRHHIGAITFRRGVAPEEVHSVLDVLSVDADRSGQPLGLGPAETLTAWRGVRLYPLTYERLHLINEGKPLEDDDEIQREQRTRAAQLWVGLARAALAADTVDAAEAKTKAADEDPDSPAVAPTQVAQAIQQHPRGTAYDQVIVGYLLQIADEVKRGGGADSIALQRRVSQLVGELDGGTLSRLLEMGGDGNQRRKFLLSASDGLAVDAVIDLVKAAGEAEHQTVSHSLLRMLQKLGQHAAAGKGRRREMADQSVRDQVGQLIRGWSLKDPNPDAYRMALQRMTSSRIADMSDRTAQREAAEPQRIIQMAIEVGSGGPALSRALKQLLDDDRLSVILKTLEGTEGADALAVVEQVWHEVASPDVVRRVVTAEPIKVDQLDLLIYRVGLDAAGPMLDALATSSSTQTRRVLLDRLVKFGGALSPLLISRLSDASWFVQRNMLALLAELPERPADFDARPFVEHTDARVRREAVRVMLSDAATRDRAIHYALADEDPRTVRVGLAAAHESGCPDSAVPLAAALAVNASSEELRVLAIRVLGTSKNPAAADALLPIAVPPRKSLIARMRTTRSAEQRAAVAALRHFDTNPRVRDVLKQLDAT